MFEELLRGPNLPFTLALSVPMVLVATEAMTVVLGSSLRRDRRPTTAPQRPFDLSPDAEPDIALLRRASDALYAGAPAGNRIAAVLRRVGCESGPTPLKIGLLAGITGVAGLLLQQAALAVRGAALPPGLALPPALAVGWLLTRRLAGPAATVARTGCGGLQGLVSHGDARAGVAAEVQLRTLAGGTVTLWCEPFDPADVIAEGSRVLAVRARLPGDRLALRILPLD